MATETKEIQFPIRRSWIMSILLFVPAVALFGAWDWFLNDRQLLPYLRFDSFLLPLYLLIFGLPHVFASFFGFFQAEYVRHYRKHLFLILPAFILAFVALGIFDIYLALVGYLIVALAHVVKQQTGIALFFGVPKNRWHWWWGWLLIAGLTSMYVILQPTMVPILYRAPLMNVVEIVFLLAAVTGVRLMFQTKSFSGIIYIVATLGMAAVGYFLVLYGYEFLSFFVVRVIHDITAFIFYITHEMNNNYHSVKNWLYKYVPFLPWSLILVVPIAAILIGVIIQSLIDDPQLLLIVLMAISFAHYYLESVIWKHDGPHREQVHIL